MRIRMVLHRECTPQISSKATLSMLYIACLERKNCNQTTWQSSMTWTMWPISTVCTTCASNNRLKKTSSNLQQLPSSRTLAQERSMTVKCSASWDKQSQPTHRPTSRVSLQTALCSKTTMACSDEYGWFSAMRIRTLKPRASQIKL